MRASAISATSSLVILENVHAALATVGSTATSIISKRQTDEINNLIVKVNMQTVKRSFVTGPIELQARGNAIVTQVLAANNSANLAPQIMTGLIDNEKLPLVVTPVVTELLRVAYHCWTLYSSP